MTGEKADRSEYLMPNTCEMCGSDALAVRVIWSQGITRYVCLNCGFSRSVPRQENLQKRVNTSINHWAQRVKFHQPYCRICGSKDNLEAHHIIPVSHSKQYAYQDTNGVTLCSDCHWLVHHSETEVME